MSKIKSLALRQTKKRKGAELIANIQAGTHNDFLLRILPNKELYALIASHYFYWDVKRQMWYSVREQLMQYGSISLLGASASDEVTAQQRYIEKMVKGGIVRRTKEGKYKRTKKIDYKGD